MSKPELLLMDEPSLGLAPKLVEKIFETILEINKSGVTIFLVEQNHSTRIRGTQRRNELCCVRPIRSKHRRE
jgi:branched-chain amino acid transport system ATP-binding protein